VMLLEVRIRVVRAEEGSAHAAQRLGGLFHFEFTGQSEAIGLRRRTSCTRVPLRAPH
jgi:hypothetical protein